MTQSLTHLLTHIIFSTKDRRKFIHPEVEEDLYRYISSLCQDRKSLLRQIGGMPDHIHLFVDLSKTIAPCKFVGDIKAHSSRWIKDKHASCVDFSWQSGYGAFSVSQSVSGSVVEYIARQKEHHKRKTFQEEYRGLLDLHGIEYDEKYLWD